LTTITTSSSLEPAVTLSSTSPNCYTTHLPRNAETCLIHTLPTDIFYKIVSYVAQDPIDLVRLQRTCRDWYQRLTPLQLPGHPNKTLLKRGTHNDNHDDDDDDENGRFLWQEVCHQRYKMVPVVGSSGKRHPPDAGWWLEWQRRHAIDGKVHGWLDQLLVACCCCCYNCRDGGANNHSFKECAALVYSLLYDIIQVGG